MDYHYAFFGVLFSYTKCMLLPALLFLISLFPLFLVVNLCLSSLFFSPFRQEIIIPEYHLKAKVLLYSTLVSISVVSAGHCTIPLNI